MTLVEVLMALVVLLLVSLAMLHTALFSIENNMINVLRDEAVSVAEQRMNELRNRPFTHSDLVDTGGSFTFEAAISRNLRNATIDFTPSRLIDDLTTDNKQVDVRIQWTWKGQPYDHRISTILRGQ